MGLLGSNNFSLNNPAIMYMVLISKTFELDKLGIVGNPETNVSTHTINPSALPGLVAQVLDTPFWKNYSIISLLIHPDSSPSRSSLESPEEEV